MATRAASEVTEATGAAPTPAPAPIVAASLDTGTGLHGSGVADMLLQRMAGVVLSSGVGVVRGRLTRGPRWANDAFLAMSGYDRAELAGLDWAALTTAAPASFLPAGPTGIAPTGEHEFIRRDGSRWPVIVSRGVDPTDSAQLILFVVDLTEARAAEEVRNGAATRYARFFEVSNVAFWSVDPQGRERLTNDPVADRLLIGAEPYDFVAQSEFIHPDDREFVVATWHKAIDTGRPYDIEVRTRGPAGGDHRWTRLQAFPDTVDGRVHSWYGTTEDVHERRLVADTLAESEQRFKRLADDIPVIIWLVDLGSRASYVSKAWHHYTGQSEIDALGHGWMRAVVPEDLGRMMPLARCVSRGKAFDFDFRLRAGDGSARWFMSSGRPRFDSAGRLVGFAGSLTDIHDRKLAERELADVQLRLSRALDGTGVGVWEWDGATDTISIRGSALGISGAGSPSEDYQQIDYRAFIHPDDHVRVLEGMIEYVEGRSDEFAIEIRVRRVGGGWIWVLDRGLATARDAEGHATRMVGTLANIDDSKRAAERLRWTVDHDSLTGLASRTLFNTRLEMALASDGPVALALLDIDDFKSVNDVFGHAAGDALLSVLAQRLADFAYPAETVARLGGDEFTLIIPDCGSPEHIIGRLEQLRALLSSPFVHDGQPLTCRSSIGVAIAPAHGGDASTLLRSADIAMYTAKAGAFGGVALYDPALGARARSETAALATVRAALDAGKVAPLYEPIVRLVDGSIAGYEALAHVLGGDGVPIDAHAFESTFGDAELTIRMGACILDHVLADFSAWHDAGTEPGFRLGQRHARRAEAGRLRAQPAPKTPGLRGAARQAPHRDRRDGPELWPGRRVERGDADRAARGWFAGWARQVRRRLLVAVTPVATAARGGQD